MKQEFNIILKREITLTQEDIDGIMSCALEGGITNWCCKAEVIENEYYGEYASDQISRGGSLRLYDSEEDETYILTLPKLLNGIKTAFAHGCGNEWFDETGKLDIYNIDANEADTMVQFALFGELVFS